jgi:non-heme chloroperoxidase
MHHYAHSAPQLELLSYRASDHSVSRPADARQSDTTSPRSLPPLLFVHGACAGAWCWEEYFLPYFAQHGFDAFALSLRGHGHSWGHDQIDTFSINDYVNDVASIAEEVRRESGQAPVLIGHSMGGLVVQKYLERACTEGVPVQAGVLMASCPATGILGSWLYWQAQMPFLAAAMTTHVQQYTRPKSAFTHTWVFSPMMNTATVDHYSRKFILESLQACWDMAVLLPNPRKITVPMLVMGAENDVIFPAYEIHATARAYRTTAKLFPNMAHAMMLEENWAEPASYLRSWLEQLQR